MGRYIYQDTVQDRLGNAIGGVVVTVYLANSSSVATIYTAISGGSAVVGSTVESDSNGKFYFYIDDSEYPPTQRFKLTFTKTGYSIAPWDYIEIIPDNTHLYFVDANATDQGVATTRADRSIKDLVDAIGDTKNATLIFEHSGSGDTTTYTVSTDETIPSNITVITDKGADISVDSSKTLTIQGSLIHRGIFSGSGSVVTTGSIISPSVGSSWDDIVGYSGLAAGERGTRIVIAENQAETVSATEENRPPVWIQKKVGTVNETSNKIVVGAMHVETTKLDGTDYTPIINASFILDDQSTSDVEYEDAFSIHSRAIKSAASSHSDWAGWFLSKRAASSTGGYVGGIEIDIQTEEDGGYQDSVFDNDPVQAEIGLWIASLYGDSKPTTAIGVYADSGDRSFYNGMIFEQSSLDATGTGINFTNATPKYGIKFGSVSGQSGAAHIYGSGTIIVDSTSLQLGLDDAVHGYLEITGETTGSPVGGLIDLYMAADYDAGTPGDQYRIRVYGYDLYIGPINNEDALKYDGDNSQWVFQDVITFLEKSANPTAPAEGQTVIWMSDGTGYGDDGDVMIAGTAGGATKYATLFDHSAGSAWS